MRVRVLLFAAHRELVGRGQVDLDVPSEATAGDVYRLLETEQPVLAQLRRSTTFAVNREVVPADSTLRPGDEIALLQPVSGGSHD